MRLKYLSTRRKKKLAVTGVSQIILEEKKMISTSHSTRVLAKIYKANFSIGVK